MDDTRISQLTFGEPLEGDEYIPIVQYSPTISALETVYTTPSALAEYIIGDAALYPVGAIIPFAGALSAKDVPRGWLLCDGSEVSIDNYPNLYSCIVNTYGNTLTGVFALPNLKGRLIVGYEDVGNVVNFNSVEPSWPRTQGVAIGSTGGEFYHKLTAKDIPCTTTTVYIPSATTTAVDTQPTIVTQAPKEVEIYNRSEKTNARTSWTDTLNLGAYGSKLPSTLDLKFYFEQCEVRVTDAGAWILVGSSGNNASKTIIKSVRPDGNGIVKVKVIDRAWGGHGLKVHALVPQQSTITTTALSSYTITQTIYWATILDGADLYTWQGNKLIITHLAAKNPSNTNITYETVKTIGSERYIINKGDYRTPSTIGTFTLPFDVLQTEDVKIVRKTGRGSDYIYMTVAPTSSNNYTTSIHFQDGVGFSGADLYTCMIQFKQTINIKPSSSITTAAALPASMFSAAKPSDGNSLVDVTQPYMLMNYIIKH